MSTRLPKEPLPCDAVAFDLDGLLIDTEPIFTIAVRRFLDRRDLPFDAEFMHSMMGEPAAQSLPRFQRHFQLRDSLEAIAIECRDLFLEELGNQPGPLMPGVLGTLDTFDAAGVPFCIATSSSREFVRRVFGPHGLLDRFRFVLTCDDVKKGKPYPEVYETAARRFNIDPRSMLVLEDSPNGLRAAKAAGANCIVVPHPLTPRHLLDEADAILSSLATSELRLSLGW